MKTLTVFDTDMNQPQENILRQETFFVCGDLQGNFFLLLTYLVQLNFLIPKSPQAYEKLLTNFRALLHSRAYNIAQIHKGLTETFTIPDDVKTPSQSKIAFEKMQQAFTRQPLLKRKFMLIGDIICDRGPSDFFTLAILDWLLKNQVHYLSLMGNHDLTPLTARFSQSDRDKSYFHDLDKSDPDFTRQYISFDYFRLPNVQQEREFINLLKSFYGNIRLCRQIFDEIKKDGSFQVIKPKEATNHDGISHKRS